MQNMKVINVLPPVAEAYEGGPNSTDVVNMQDYKHCTFILYEGVGTTGTATVTVESCDNTTPTTPTAVAFRYKEIATTDIEGEITAATTSGFGTTVGSNGVYLIEIDDDMLSGTDKYVRLKLTELADAAVLAGVLCILSGSSFSADSMRTAIT
jgi:hypothetical protein